MEINAACRIGKHIKAAGSTKTIWGISGLCSLIFYPWHVKQLKNTLSKSVFYQIILQASSFKIPRWHQLTQQEGWLRQRHQPNLVACGASLLLPARPNSTGMALLCCLIAQKTKEITFMKKKNPTQEGKNENTSEKDMLSTFVYYKYGRKWTLYIETQKGRCCYQRVTINTKQLPHIPAKLV